jgi:cytochrome c
MRRVLSPLALLVALPACQVENPKQEQERTAAQLTGGDPGRGRVAALHYGCASCHTIPGVPGNANVGPPLDRVGGRVYIGGVLLNTPDNMRRWIKDPPAVDPLTAMPNLGVTDEDLKDIAAYLYTLR